MSMFTRIPILAMFSHLSSVNDFVIRHYVHLLPRVHVLCMYACVVSTFSLWSTGTSRPSRVRRLAWTTPRPGQWWSVGTTRPLCLSWTSPIDPTRSYGASTTSRPSSGERARQVTSTNTDITSRSYRARKLFLFWMILDDTTSNWSPLRCQ